jgi:quinol monooxygenase YgiN
MVSRKFTIAKDTGKGDVMPGEELTVLARIRAKNGKEAEVLHEIILLMAPTRAEEGCINYDLHCSNDDPDLFLLYETWRSRQHLDKHLAMPYLQTFLEKAPELLGEPIDLSFWELVS